MLWSYTSQMSIRYSWAFLISQCFVVQIVLAEYYSNYDIRIRTVSKYYMSSWINSEKISYMFTVDPDPPILQITHVDKTMHINATLKKPACIRNYEFDVKYVLEIWKIGKPNESILNITTDNSILTQETTGLIGTYCVAAQTIYQVDRKKLSKFSSPICQVFEGKILKTDSHVGS
ncbi:interferon lambda receptor 1 isoform X3 [Pelobates cultripes]|uniref:Interferon lambda receptor 1 isoform X3 n=2 Tax=Pelobates cultripes TaxID=61616 RepID=A0AAD1VMY5_PELCU|nr:interferon lambda receptor 1 isoform X3 [Pelobates cultripes]